MMVFADEPLRRCFVGLYDVKASNITPPQQRVLERLALARGNGVTQNQLCKELGTPANNFFYVVKRLESWGLVTRQSTIVRTKEASSDKEPKSNQPVHTNLIRLHRYAVPLDCQQRLEITKENKNLDESLGGNVAGGDCISEEHGQDDVLVKDFLPALKAVCDRLEQAEGKVLVVSDIKRELGYRETRGHRAWRNICNRLKQAGLVEVFEAKVDDNAATTTNSKRTKSRVQNKAVSCLRLLKEFSPKLFGKRATDCEYDNLVPEQTIIGGNQIQNTEQLVELPLEQQIFDMIDQEGSKGLLGVEVCRRLGITNKMLDNLSNAMVPRFGLHQLSENRKRGSAYRFWTRGSFSPQFPNSSLNKSEGAPDEHGAALSTLEEPSYCENSQGNITALGSITLQKSIAGKNTSGYNEQVLSHDPLGERGSCGVVVWSKDSQDLIHDESIALPASVTETESNGKLVIYSPLPVRKPFNLQQGQRYPSLTSAQREQRILEKLKTEKIILKPELQRWLDSFDKDKGTRMDRKTLARCLKRLKSEGHCKTMVFNVPGVTNCGRPRDVLVILHPSVECSHGELSDQVVDRVRSFEMQIRGALSQSKKELPVPVLHGIQRIKNKSNSDAQSVKSEVMRANGFVLAKMVRTKLLHQYLWRYVNNSVECSEASSWSKHVHSRNPHSSCLLFELDAAIKGMPLELFLQVVGCAFDLKDVTEKCKTGLLLSDLPLEEYKSLMDTRATGRLSWLIDILRRLKLMRLVADESGEDAADTSHATLVYALELKPYIEEPPSVDLFPGGSGYLDLRPHFRHDFVLSTSEAVDKYWQTLEYCYAAADAKAALHAFPGSVVHEVCFYKSWTTVRVMSAEQRAELFKRIKDQPRKKLTFRECREIAKDLKLSLEQVLRVYYDHRQKRLNRVQGDLDVQGSDSDVRNDIQHQCPRKRKISSEGRSAKRMHANFTAAENAEEPGVAEQEENHESLHDHCPMPMLMKPRQPKFSWTEVADRQLLIQYARQRAIQGARCGTKWALISDLPAPPSTCRRRLAVLITDVKFRESLIRLCNLLSKRYARQMHYGGNLMNESDGGQESDNQGAHWDDFDDDKIKIALNEVLTYKRMMKVDTSKRMGSAPESSQNTVSNARGCEDSEQQQIESSRRSRLRCLPQKFVKHLKEGYSTARQLSQSLAVASAVELFKLVFLTTSKSMETPSLLAETLRSYSEHDLYSAFDYLREKKIMVGCDTSQPFVLSQHFLRSLSASEFPVNTGKRASKLATWMHEKTKELMEGKVNLPADLQCGDIFYLFALVSSGELSINPLLPNEGVGEAEDSRSSKRKYDDHEFNDDGIIKKSKCHSPQECEINARREKGFPGITVSLSCTTISRSNIVEFFKHEDKALIFGENDHFYDTLVQKESSASSAIDHIKESPAFGSIIPATVIYGESPWELMASYTMQHLLQHSGQEFTEVHPELIKSSHKIIEKAGDQGVSISKFSEYAGIQDPILAECVIDVLQLFGMVLKVHGYNSIHIVDSRYCTKYFLTSKATRCQDPEKASSLIPQAVNNETNIVQELESCEHEVNCMNADEVHKVTVLNLAEDVSQHLNAIEAHNEVEGCSQSESIYNAARKRSKKFDMTAALRPILPWINGDGTINGIVHRGLTRRILGIVTQHPGILEDDMVSRMEVLNPQSCRRLLELMVLDKHLIVRKMYQRATTGPPALLESLIGKHSKKPKFVCQEHYFANPMSVSLL